MDEVKSLDLNWTKPNNRIQNGQSKKALDLKCTKSKHWVQNQLTQGISTARSVAVTHITGRQQQRPESPTITSLGMQCKVHKLHKRRHPYMDLKWTKSKLQFLSVHFSSRQVSTRSGNPQARHTVSQKHNLNVDQMNDRWSTGFPCLFQSCNYGGKSRLPCILNFSQFVNIFLPDPYQNVKKKKKRNKHKISGNIENKMAKPYKHFQNIFCTAYPEMPN